MSSATETYSPEGEMPFAGWIMLFRPATYLRPDIIVTAIMIPAAIFMCQCWGICPNFTLDQYLLSASVLFLFSTVPTFLVFFLRSIIVGRVAPLSQRLCFASYTINVAVLVTMSWIYAHVKSGVLLGPNYDDQLRAIERTLLFGHEAWAVAQNVIPLALAGFFTVVYWLFKPLILATIFWLILVCKTRKANELTCAIVLGYYIGVLGYHLLPSYGPAYMDPDASPMAFSERTATVQQLLLWHTQEVQRHPGTAEIVPWKYIGAFPSLHFSHVLILVWYMWYSKFGRVFYSAFAVLTAISTIYLGWHYLIDLAGGVAVAALAVWATELCRGFACFGVTDDEGKREPAIAVGPALAPAYLSPATMQETCAVEASA